MRDEKAQHLAVNSVYPSSVYDLRAVQPARDRHHLLNEPVREDLLLLDSTEKKFLIDGTMAQQETLDAGWLNEL